MILSKDHLNIIFYNELWNDPYTVRFLGGHVQCFVER